MKRFSIRNGVGLSLLAGAVACSQNATAGVGVTNSEAVVAGCEKVAEVSVGSLAYAQDVKDALAAEGRKRGANYVLVASEGARTGTAYRCSMPSGAGATTGH